MEKFIMKGKAVQIFTAFFLPQPLLSFIPNFDPNVDLAKNVIISLAYLIWVFMLGRALNMCIPARHRLSETYQQIFLFVFVIIFVPIMMFTDIGVHFFGWAVWIRMAMLFSLLYLFYFASKAPRSAENEKRAAFSEHFGEMLMLIFVWIGIWFIQPRINALYDKNKNQFDEE